MIVMFAYSLTITEMIVSGMPYFANISQSVSWLTESNAFTRYKNSSVQVFIRVKPRISNNEAEMFQHWLETVKLAAETGRCLSSTAEAKLSKWMTRSLRS
jgi:hypothetical protein